MAQTDTKDKILDIAEGLFLRRGYSGFSYQDIATALGIRKASLHYHFPAKADLGMALANRHAQRMAKMLRSADKLNMSAWQKLDVFLNPFIALVKTQALMSTTGTLAADFPNLPEPMQIRAGEFFTVFHDWLAHVLDQGRRSGQFYFGCEPTVKANAIIATLEGAILIARARQDGAFIDPLIADIKATLGG